MPRLPVAPYNRLAGTRPATARLLAAALGAGVLVDLAIRSGLAGLGGAIAVLGLVAAMLLSGRLLTTQSKLLTGAAALFGGWLAIRSSEWLLPLDLIAAFGLLVLGASLSSGGSVTDLPVYRLFARAWHAAVHSFAAPAWAIRVGSRIGPRLGPTALRLTVGLVVAVPVLITLGALLSSADAVFASMLPDLSSLDGADVVLHVFLILVGGWLLLGLLRTASARPPQPMPGPALRLGKIEMTTVLGLVIVLLGFFAIAQVVAAVGGDAYVQRTTGMTYAEYARTGFFQLLAVAAIIVALLVAMRAASCRETAANRKRFGLLSAAVCALTAVVVVVAIRRLALYQDVYGLTMLRLYCTLFAAWIGVVLLLLAAWLNGVRPNHGWFPPAAAAGGLVLLFGLNLANPEAIVAQTNLQRQTPVPVDNQYLTELSDDAVPTIVEVASGLDDAAATEVRDQLCSPYLAYGRSNDNERYIGWAAWNLSDQRADAEIAEFCQPTPGG